MNAALRIEVRDATEIQVVPGTPHPFGLATKLYLLAIFLMPLQLEIEQFTNTVGSRFPPGDFCLVGAVLLAPHMIRFGRFGVSLLTVAFVAVLAYGLMLAILYAGVATTHAVAVKFVGGCMLVAWCTVTISHVRAGLAATVTRTWIAGMAFWGVVSFIDWRIADIVPVITHDLETRFGGAQFDQNNAGIAFGVAAVIMWQSGRRLFATRYVQAAVQATLVVALLLTLSRSAFVAVAGAGAIVLFFDTVGATRWLRYIAVGCCMVLLALATGFADSAIEDFRDRPDNVSSRQTLADDALDSFAESNGLGIGLGTQLSQQDQLVHNTAILLLVETSIVGLGFFGAMVLVPARAAWRSRRFEPQLGMGVFAGLLVMAIASLAVDTLYQRQWWLLVGLCALEFAAPRRRAPAPDSATRSATTVRSA